MREDGDVSYEGIEETIGLNTTFEISAKTGCFYPQPKIQWCLNNTDFSERCSNQSNYWQNVFKDDPTILEETQVCSKFNDTNVISIQSTFSATTEATGNVTNTIHLYLKIDDNTYEDGSLGINLRTPPPQDPSSSKT